jgi:hypothetical protein
MKKSLLFLLIFSGFFPYSCTTCNEPPVKDFYIKSFDLKTVDLAGLQVDTSQFFSHDSLAKSLTIKEKTDVVFNNAPGFSLFTNTAYACSPPEPMSMETITKMEIIARSQFSAAGDTIKPGDNITADFLIGEPYTYSNFKPANQDINNKQRLHIQSNLLIKYSKKPDMNTPMKFDVLVTLSNNDVHSFTGQTLKIR